MEIWTPGALVCRVCGARFARHHEERFKAHLLRCVERHADLIDDLRPPEYAFEGDPELLAFGLAEGDVYNRRPGTRRRPR